MIEFNGYISGNAEKYFWEKSRKMVQKIFMVSMLLLFPIIIYAAVKTSMYGIITGYVILIVLVQLCTYIPKGQKEKKSLTPKLIYTEDEYIVCVADQYEEFKAICDVETVIDYGEFYALQFPIGNVSDKFICQKELLSAGSLEEFENIFDGKIVRKQNR